MWQKVKQTICLHRGERMAIKSLSIRIEEKILQKPGYVADYEGRSVYSHILVLFRESIKN